MAMCPWILKIKIFILSVTPPHLYEYLSGHEYVCFVLEIKGKSHPDKKLVSELFDLFDLSSSDQNSLIKNYSFGMRRKVVLIAGFLLNPPLMILDEPTTGLDAASIVILKKLIRGIIFKWNDISDRKPPYGFYYKLV